MEAENLHKEVGIVICTLTVESQILKNLCEAHKAIEILHLTLSLPKALVL
jgi:hypothetical protein